MLKSRLERIRQERLERQNNQTYIWLRSTHKKKFDRVVWTRDSDLDDPCECVWYLYSVKSKSVVKIEADSHKDVLDYAKKQFQADRWSTIAAAPRNFFDFPELDQLPTGLPQVMEGFDFSSLKKRLLACVERSEWAKTPEDEDFRVEINFRKIVQRRREAVVILDTKLSELKERFPKERFEKRLISYYTYHLSPACLRNIEELCYNDELEQDASGTPFGYSEYLDAKYDKPDPEDYSFREDLF
jgi:hypothetical protein